MQGLVIYNGSSKTKKVQDAALKVCEELSRNNVKMQSIRNNQILNYIDNENNSNIVLPDYIQKPDFVLAWDKDIKLIEMIEKMGIRTFNSSDSIRACDDKSIMHTKLINSGIKIPKTIISPLVFRNYDFDEQYYNNIIKHLGRNFILKENVGSFGMQVYQIKSYDDFANITGTLGNQGFILQEAIQTSVGKDLRVNIVGNEVIGVMLRENADDFRANITLGGKATMYNASDAILEEALKAHKALGLGFSGVDILFGNNDTPVLCEVNSNPNFLSFEKVSGMNFAKKIADYIIGEMND